MHSLKEQIRETEETWLLPLLNHCHNLFAEVFLPSHDHLHHFRVWNQAKDIMFMLEETGFRIPDGLPQQLILAAFFHDTGLVHSHDEKHGMESRKLCEAFFRNEEQEVPEGFTEILDAIEHHDDKSFRDKKLANKSGKLVFSILSASDDLDAFGYTGIYRYAEIYLHRGIHPEELAGRVLENLHNRFENLRSNFDSQAQFIDRQKVRYGITREFYLGLAAAFAADPERSNWKVELIRVFQDGIRRKENLLKPDRLLPALVYGREIGQYFLLIDEENALHEHA